jgi:hypothetical protein
VSRNPIRPSVAPAPGRATISALSVTSKLRITIGSVASDDSHAPIDEAAVCSNADRRSTS